MNNEAEQSLEEKARESLETAMRHEQEAPAKFLVAWKKGVNKVGHQYFRIDSGISVDEAPSKEALQPNWEAINSIFTALSSGEQALLSLMYSFYDSVDGQKLLERSGKTNFVDAIAAMDCAGQKIIAELCAYYTGW